MVRSLMAGAIPSRITWRARSVLVQWVMCSPLATGSRQASWTIWARWRGGNPVGMSRPARRGQEPCQPRLLVPTARPPDGGLIALHLEGDRARPHASCVGEHDASPSDLIPGQGLATGDLLECRQINRGDGERSGSSSTHRATSPRWAVPDPSIIRGSEFLALLMARDTSTSCPSFRNSSTVGKGMVSSE
jgi:hypothetical protein